MAYNPEEHKEQWLKAIDEAGGMITIVAQKLGIHRNTVARFRDSIPWIKEAFQQSDWETTDIAKGCIKKFVGSNWKAAAWWLERKAKMEGFGKEIKVDADITQRGKVVIMLPDNNRNPEVHERRDNNQTE